MKERPGRVWRMYESRKRSDHGDRHWVYHRENRGGRPGNGPLRKIPAALLPGAKKTLELLEQAAPYVGERPFTAAISGSAGLGLAEGAGVPFVQEVFATGEVVRRLEPDASAVIELGGEDAKIIFFDGGIDERMNGSCAGGTGAFIDQMATLLNAT